MAQLCDMPTVTGTEKRAQSYFGTPAPKPTLDDLLEEQASPERTTAAQRMRGAEQALDAVRGKFGKDSARLGL